MNVLLRKIPKTLLIAIIIIGVGFAGYVYISFRDISMEKANLAQEESNFQQEKIKLIKSEYEFSLKKQRLEITDSIRSAKVIEEKNRMELEKNEQVKRSFLLKLEAKKVGYEAQIFEAKKRIINLVKEISEVGEARRDGEYFLYNKEYRILQSKLDELHILSEIAGLKKEYATYIQDRRAKSKPSIIIADK